MEMKGSRFLTFARVGCLRRLKAGKTASDCKLAEKVEDCERELGFIPFVVQILTGGCGRSLEFQITCSQLKHLEDQNKMPCLN